MRVHGEMEPHVIQQQLVSLWPVDSAAELAGVGGWLPHPPCLLDLNNIFKTCWKEKEVCSVNTT